ncbi:tumor necrosis factor receptor superfamily member 5 [Tiliqua scincoides]|uniref:tumor necrosis factor receptor superfamily member 5 n=1 Tax=Tiliqua scincoides TaxID=71010 RepID=UPI0034629FE8
MERGRLSGWGWACGCCALLACLVLGQGQKCSSTQYEQNGRCCNKCSPGQKVRTECAGEAETVCEPCARHHFQGSWTREMHCTPHRDCDENAGLVVEIPGNASRNVVCRCKNGTHCSSQECQTCRVNKPCGPGEGVQQEASGASDTVCMVCPHGYFSSSSSATARCQPWSSCETKQLIQKVNGTHVSDVVCADVQTLPESKEESKRIYSLPVVLVSVAAVSILGGGAVLFLWCQNHREPQKYHVNQEPHCQPMEVVFEDDECPALPVQETLPGGQPVAQEDGKDSHLAQQEHP